MPSIPKERQIQNNYGSGQRTTITRDTVGEKTRVSGDSLMIEENNTGARMSQYKLNAAAQG